MEKMVRFFMGVECLSYNSCFNRFLYYKIFALTLKYNTLIFIFQCIFQNKLRFLIITVFFTRNIAVKNSLSSSNWSNRLKVFYNKHCKAWRPADLLKWDTGVFLSIFQCNLICTPHANGCFCDVFFVSFFLFSQRKNSFLKSSSLKTGYTSRVISRGVLAARLFSSMMSKNQILSKPVMNVVHQMRMKNQIHFLVRSGWLFLTKPLLIKWSSLSELKTYFQGFVCPLPHTSESRMSRNYENCL